MSAFGSGPSNGQFWYGSSTNFPGFLYKKNVGVGGRRSTKMGPGGNITCNSSTYLYNKYKPGTGGVGASSTANRRAKNRLATVCTEQKCFPCYMTLGQYSNYTHNPNGYVGCPQKSNIIDWLTYIQYTRGPAQGILEQNFGWDSNGIWFNGDAGRSRPAFPVFTNFVIPSNKKVVVTVDFIMNNACTDFGFCFYNDGETPRWRFGPDPTRIQLDNECFYEIDIYGFSGPYQDFINLDPSVILEIGKTYTCVGTYDPTTLDTNGNPTITYAQFLNGVPVWDRTITVNNPALGNYRIGFCADADDPNLDRTYMKNLTINVNNGEQVYRSSLQNINLLG